MNTENKPAALASTEGLGLVERLRQRSGQYDEYDWHGAIELEAAAEIERLQRANKVLELKNAASLANNLCPDHRDKQAGKTCLACEIERLRADRVALLRELDLVLRHYEGLLRSEYQTRNNTRPDEACPVATHARHIIAKMMGPNVGGNG